MIKIWVNGTFDILHRGHLELLSFAKKQGDYLTVGIDSDTRVKLLKGEHRPVNAQEDRRYFLQSLIYVDNVIIFKTDKELSDIINNYNPDIFVIGSDYRNKKIIGEEWAKKLIFFEKIKGYSSTSIINKI